MPLHAHAVLVMTAKIQTENRVFTNISYWQKAADFDPDGANMFKDIANDFFDQTKDLYSALIGTECFVNPPHARWYDGDGNTWEADSDDSPEGGDAINLATSLPDQDALVIRRITGKVGRQHRGRMFVPGLTTLCQDKGQLTSIILIADFKAHARALAQFYGADRTFNGVVFHARHYNRKDDALEVVRATYAMNNLASRRDRARALGANVSA